jgi:uncharacterized glyoxalase superfamily protein PhnB
MAKLVSIMPSVPICVPNVALAFYCGRLGFGIRHQFDTGGAILIRDSVELHLTPLNDETWRSRADFMSRPVKSGAESFLPGTSAYRIEVNDVRALYEEYRAKGAIHPRGELTEQPWGDVDFAVGDPDGNLLTFFQRDVGNAAKVAEPPASG